MTSRHRIAVEKLPSEAKLIPGLGCYYATPSGQIYSVYTPRKASEVTGRFVPDTCDGKTSEPLVLQLRQTSLDGYRHVTVRLLDKNITYKVHRLVLMAFVGLPPSSAHVTRHLDGNRSNNVVENLAWGTSRENCADRTRHGRQVDNAGELNGRAFLCERAVLLMRALFCCGARQKHVAQLFRITPFYAHRIVRGQVWKHLPLDPNTGSVCP